MRLNGLNTVKLVNHLFLKVPIKPSSALILIVALQPIQMTYKIVVNKQ